MRGRMTRDWLYSEPEDRVNIDRFMPLCGKCHHYVKCVARKSYCPPYSLAVRWHCPDRYKERIKAEIEEAKAKGWFIEDYCKICNWRCKIKRIRYEKQKEIFWNEYFRYAVNFITNALFEPAPCEAFKYVFLNIPCPVRKIHPPLLPVDQKKGTGGV